MLFADAVEETRRPTIATHGLNRDAPPARPEVLREPVSFRARSASSKSRFRRGSGSSNIGAVRKVALLVVLALIWEVYARLARQSAAVSDVLGDAFEAFAAGPVRAATLLAAGR